MLLGCTVARKPSLPTPPTRCALAAPSLQLAFKFVPSREEFLTNVGGSGPEVMGEMAAFVDGFSALLEEVHKWMVRAAGSEGEGSGRAVPGCGGMLRPSG